MRSHATATPLAHFCVLDSKFLRQFAAKCSSSSCGFIVPCTPRTPGCRQKGSYAIRKIEQHLLSELWGGVEGVEGALRWSRNVSKPYSFWASVIAVQQLVLFFSDTRISLSRSSIIVPIVIARHDCKWRIKYVHGSNTHWYTPHGPVTFPPTKWPTANPRQTA